MRRIGLEGAGHLGDYITIDARETLATFMVGSVPNANAFHHHMTSLLQQVLGSREQTPLRIYGEMVDVLWKDGHETAALRVETLWNESANTHAFKLLCGYSMRNFYKGAAVEAIKQQHSHVVNERGEHAAVN